MGGQELQFAGAKKVRNRSKEAPGTLQPDLFTPSHRRKGANRFAVIGDAGSGNKHQYDIAEQMAQTYQKKPFDSVLVLGDNVYNYGEPQLFEDRIYRPYQKLFDEQVKFFPVLGNHDVERGHGDQQLTYWGAPQFYNVRKGDVEFFALDSTVFLPGYVGTYLDNPGRALKQAEIQYQWLDKALGDSTAKYKVVFAHYPMYSSDNHANDPALIRWRKRMEPLLAKHNVDVFLAGHDHHYERTGPIQGVRHFISGGGGMPGKGALLKVKYPREKVIPRYHFMLFEVSDQGLQYEAIGRNGKVLDAGVVPPKQQKMTRIRFA